MMIALAVAGYAGVGGVKLIFMARSPGKALADSVPLGSLATAEGVAEYPPHQLPRNP